MSDFSKIVEKIKPSIALIITDSGTGSGFVFWKKNMLVTCNHVVKGATAVLLKFPSGEFIPAKVVVQDEEHDIALLRFTDESKPPLLKGDLENVKEGMGVIFAGYPLSLQDLTTHQGIVSAITKDATGITTYLIDGTVNPGNSGCPLMDEDGRVIGVVNATQRQHMDVITKVRDMAQGAVSLYGVDLVQMYQAMIANVQLGIGYAVPANYIPEHKEISIDVPQIEIAKVLETKSENKKDA